MRVIGAMRRPTTSILGRNNFRSNTGRSGDENDDFNDFDHPLQGGLPANEEFGPILGPWRSPLPNGANITGFLQE